MTSRHTASGWLRCWSKGRRREHGSRQASNMRRPAGTHIHTLGRVKRKRCFSLIAWLHFNLIFYICTFVLCSEVFLIPCPDPLPVPPYYFSSGLCFLVCYLVPVNKSFPGLGCRGLCWRDSGYILTGIWFATRSTVLCLPECAYCTMNSTHLLHCTSLWGIFTIRHPFVLCSSDRGVLTAR